MRGDELLRVLLQVSAHFAVELGEQGRVADEEAAVQVRRQGREILAADAQALGHAAHRGADHHAAVPEPGRDRLGDRLDVRVLLPAIQEQEVDVRAERELAPPVAADGDHREAEVQAREVLEVAVLGEPEQLAHEPVHQLGVLFVHLASGRARVVELEQMRAHGVEIAAYGRVQVLRGRARRASPRRSEEVVADGLH